MADTDGPLWRALDRTADHVVVGALVCLTSLPVVTLLPSLSAATAVLAEPDRPGSLPARYAAALRGRLRAGIPLTVVAVVLLGVAAVDLGWALSRPLTPSGTLVLAAGTLLGLAVAAVAVTVCTRLDGRPPRAVLVESAVAAAASPLRALLPAAAAAAGLAAAFAVPVLLPLAAALLARTLGWAPRRVPVAA